MLEHRIKPTSTQSYLKTKHAIPSESNYVAKKGREEGKWIDGRREKVNKLHPPRPGMVCNARALSGDEETGVPVDPLARSFHRREGCAITRNTYTRGYAE